MRREVSTDHRYGAPISLVEIKKKKKRIIIAIADDKTKTEKKKKNTKEHEKKKKTRMRRGVVQRSIDSDQSYRVYRGF